MSRRHPFLDGLLKGRFSFMLISLVAMFFIVPLAGNSQSMIDEMFGWFSIVVLISCLRAISQSRRFFYFMVLLTIINVILSGSEIVVQDETRPFLMTVLGFKIIYFVLVFVSIMRFVLNSEQITADKICGAISAYLLMGIIWSFIYTIFHHIDSASITVPAEWLSTNTINSYWAIYFSFTTLTTLGYGDITPQTPLTQSYAVMEAAIGQIFLAVIVARLIALHITYERDPK